MSDEREIQMIAITLGSLLYPKDMKKLGKSHVTLIRHLPDELNRLDYLSKFHEALYCFSMSKIQDFLENRYICYLLKLFIRTIHQ